MLKLALVALTVTLARADLPQGRSLAAPDLRLCQRRVIHETGPDGKGYYFSWRDPELRTAQYDWLDARNHCRRQCMETVSLETSIENEWVKERIVKDNVKYIWTSGRKCDFKGCDRPDLLPTDVNGWFWTATLEKLAPSTQRDQNDWSPNGGLGKPQPDNREPQQGGAQENCLAVLNQFYNDGVNWHDVACHHVKPFVCEENPDLARLATHVS
ncbi:L-selectin [Euwallacea fornicatus]|uniref:L-selectin n=1 Tax=Euwallacea fornicatus TaxID=995702 RepID=UPI0033906E6F